MLLLVLFSFIICLQMGSGKYAETPSFVLQVFDQKTNCDRRHAELSPDDNQLMIFCLNQNKTNTTSQEIFHFNSTKICSNTIKSKNLQLLTWPLQTKGIFGDYQQRQTFKKQPGFCSQLVNLISLQQNYTSFAFRNTTQTSFITLLMDKNQILEYDLSSGSLTRNSTLSGNEVLQTISYSTNQKYIFTEDDEKVIVYDASSLQRLREIKTLPYMRLMNGMDDGKSFFASNFMDRSFSFFYINQTGNRVIRNYVFVKIDAGKFDEQFVGMCTMDSVIVVLELGINGEYDLITYKSTNGEVVQNITLSLEGNVQISSCNNNYLLIVDQSGSAYIYNYTKLQPKPQPTPDPEPDTDNNSLPLIVWTVIVIAMFQTIVIGVLGTIIYRKKRANKQLNEKLMNSQTSSQIDD